MLRYPKPKNKPINAIVKDTAGHINLTKRSELMVKQHCKGGYGGQSRPYLYYATLSMF